MIVCPSNNFTSFEIYSENQCLYKSLGYGVQEKEKVKVDTSDPIDFDCSWSRTIPVLIILHLTANIKGKPKRMSSQHYSTFF